MCSHIRECKLGPFSLSFFFFLGVLLFDRQMLAQPFSVTVFWTLCDRASILIITPSLVTGSGDYFLKLHMWDSGKVTKCLNSPKFLCSPYLHSPLSLAPPCLEIFWALLENELIVRPLSRPYWTGSIFFCLSYLNFIFQEVYLCKLFYLTQ